MKKRILSILLTLCMTLCFTPISVFAEEVGAGGSAAIKLGADALSVLSKNVNTATAPTVYFGQNHENNPAAWRVIGYDGSGVTSSQGDITLLAAGAMGVIPFVDTILNNEYAPSNLKTAIDALAEKLTTEENAAVKKRALTSGSYDGENTDCVAGGQVDNAVFWPLSTAEAFAVNNDLRALEPAHPNWVTTAWWLRSPGSNKYHLAVVTSDGSVQYSGHTILIFNNHRTVRPAFKLNMNSVLFASAAVGGKPDGGLTPIPEYSGNEWKLTLLDSRRNFAVTEKTVSAAPDDTVTLNYKGATTGKNEYISVILADNNGAQYYGRVAQPTAESGTVEIKIPSDIAPGDYTMKVFSEQYNGDCKTDLASAFADVTLTVESQPDEQFTLAPGGRYYFDLSAMNIPGTVNSNLPDSTLHYVPFTYVGTVNAYKLTSEMATTEEYAQKNKYPHSLFIADYAVTHTVSWDDLNTAGLIFGKNYASGGVDYTLRTPSVGSDCTGLDDSQRGVPQSNEWDRILNKDSSYIKNWNGIYSWGQDTTRYNSSLRAVRGYDSGRRWNDDDATDSLPLVGFRPVLEVLNPDTLGSDGLKVVTLDLGGGTLGGSSEDIQIIVKSSESFAAPASDGMTRPDGNTGSYFMWLGSNGKLYAPGASVPADVTKLTAQFVLSEQFSLTPGGRYYFDLSAMNIPGTVNSNLPDSTLHYVPFTYVGTVNAYRLTSETATTEEYAQKNKYPHSLFVADYAVTHTVSWDNLNTAGLIFGKDYAAGGVDYTLRAPSVGSSYTGSGDSERGTPKSNEWDKILDKDDGYIKNWREMLSCGQDTTIRISASFRAVRGWKRSARFWTSYNTSYSTFGFRPVLEVLNPDTLGSDGLKVVTLDLNGGKLGNSSEDIQIIVKSGESFTAPASDGLTRPGGDTDNYFMWLDGNGNSYEPGGSVPADVTELTVQWTAPTYAVTLNTNGGTINSGNVTGYTYGVGATLPAADDMTYTGHTFKGWYDNENLTGSPVTAIGGAETGNKEYWAKWEINQYTITFDTNGGSEIAPITQDYGTEITAPDNPTRKGYSFKGWDKEIPKTMPAENITVKAQWEINQYTITFDTNGGSEIAPITQDYGTEITAPDNPTRKGYSFKGWDKEIPKTMPAENITVKAQWEINQYTITFDTNGGSEIAPITQDYGTEITAPDNPTRKGYTFKGWDKEIPETMPAENITVKAQWEINQYTITFDTNGGSEIAPITQDYGTEITAPDNPTRKGYTFKGWDKEIPETMPAENITVKAQWEINPYTITFDTNGGSEIAPITQDYGTEITAPADPTRKGYTFKGWDKEIPETMPAENITVKAQWEINQYTIAFDTNGGSEIAPITQDYGTEITAPDNPTRKGYTFKGWDKEIPETMPAENITVKAQWEINQYTITFDTNGGSEIAPITQDYGTEITAPDNPTRKGYTFKGWDKEIPETMPAENITITARWKDTEKPTGEIIIGTNKWNEFLNELTFGIFFKDTQEVTINAVDNSGVVFVSYLVTDKELSEAELNSLVFRAYEEPFCIDPNGEYIIYVMLVDENINITYLRSDRITLDNIQPVISGIENGKTYCEAQTVTVDEKYIDTVTVNGTAVTLDADGGFVLPPTNGEQKIVVIDKSGNNAEMTVTVNNGHTFGEWVSDNDGKHTRKCTVDGCDAFETENCSGGNATCTEKAVCDVCGKAYGEFDGTNHEGGVQEWTTRTAFNHEQKWNCCGAVIVASEAHEWKDGVCRECGYVCLHNDADKDHICDYCKKTISEHVDKDKNHICDYCEKTISAHEDATPEEIKKPDTVTAKPDDSKSPQTGDNSNLILWIALLIISGGVMKGVAAFGKSKKHSAKIKDK
nr:InlB B-repeat-containing protein [Ruminococcus bromii]